MRIGNLYLKLVRKKQKKDKIPYSKIGNVLSEYAEEFRKELIIKQTKSERVFKKYLKSLNITHVFQRIVYCNNSFYIVDFFLPKENIVFEIDGGYHESVEQRIKDDFRTDNLIKSGINQIYRFTNKEVLNESETITRIKSICERY